MSKRAILLFLLLTCGVLSGFADRVAGHTCASDFVSVSFDPNVQSSASESARGKGLHPRPAETDNAREDQGDRHRLAREYSRGWYWFYFFSQGFIWVVLFLVVWTGFSARLRQLSARVTDRVHGVILVYGLLLLAVLAVLFFPLDLFVYWRERQFGFAVQGFWPWFLDEFKEFGVTLAVGLPVVLAFYLVLKRFPRTWWLWGAGTLIGFVILTVAVAPVFISPLFNTYEPLRDAALRERILRLAGEHGIRADEVYQMDASRQTTHTNAYAVGLLGTQRIVLYDTLIEKFTPEEIEFIMTHEIGHDRLNHIWKGIGLSSVAILIGMWLLYRVSPQIIDRCQDRFHFREVRDVASLPLILLLFSLASFVADPVSNGISRMMERQADQYALEAAPQPDAALTVYQKFETLDLSESDPPTFIEFWLYSHPSLKHRIEAANEFLASL